MTEPVAAASAASFIVRSSSTFIRLSIKRDRDNSSPFDRSSSSSTFIRLSIKRDRESQDCEISPSIEAAAASIVIIAFGIAYHTGLL